MTSRSRLLVFLLLAPVLIHLVGLALAVEPRGGQPVAFDAVDFYVVLAMVAYLVVCIRLAGQPSAAARATLAVYSLLFSLAFAECVLEVVDSRAENLPLVPRHYVTYPGEHLPGCPSPAHWSVSRYGVRGPEAAPSSFDQSILCVGGSTTECFFVNDEDTWPWRLQMKLTEALGEPVYVGNAGKAGHSVVQHRYLLAHYTYVKDFRWVVLFVGFNDLHRILAPGDFQPLAHREVFPGGAIPFDPLNAFRQPGFYYRHLAISRRLGNALFGSDQPVSGRAIIQDPQADYVITCRSDHHAALKRQPFDELPEIAGQLSQYQKDLVAAIDQCWYNGQKVIVMTQPTLYRENLSPDLESLFWVTFTGRGDCAYTSRALAEGMERINAATREVCRTKGTPCLDLVPIVPQDTSAFCDQCHLNQPGCEIVADALTRFILEKKLFSPDATWRDDDPQGDAASAP